MKNNPRCTKNVPVEEMMQILLDPKQCCPTRGKYDKSPPWRSESWWNKGECHSCVHFVKGLEDEKH